MLLMRNREKTMRAPVCIIIGYDLDFYEHLPKIAARCPASTMRASTAISSPVPTSSRTFFVVGATAVRACYSPARRFGFDEMARII
jgi:hypothetical protein